MTREKEIEQAMKDSVAETIYASGWGMTPQATDLLECAFTKGAKWADENPNNRKVYTKDELYKMGFAFDTNGNIVTADQLNEDLKRYLKYQKQKFIEKATEWLWNNFYEHPHERWLICSESFDTIEYMIERFKAAMEE